MSLASAAGVLLKKQTPLQQLLEDINFQRTKEMRQLLKDDSGFVVLQGTTYWTDLFVRHFLFQTEPVHSIDSDDLLFFVRKKHVKSSSRHMPKFETEVEVFRKDSRKLPIGDPDVDWEETVYLNMVIHQFDYTLTLAICTRTSPKELQVLRRHSQRVYASPSRRKMDTKGEGEEITYPHICFMVDNFDEVFSDILVRDGEMVCVELVANDKDGAVQGVIFLGSIRYDALKKVYDARQSSLSSKVAQRMSFGLFSSGANVQTRCEFVRMKGPQGKGHAEMAVTKPKGSGVETPTSEPGFCATDMWDEWEEENDDYCTYRHQRRLSDPSANLNNFTRYGWRTKGTQDSGCGSGPGAKARSENEGLDSLASEVSEIEAGDLRDDLRPAFSASLPQDVGAQSQLTTATPPNDSSTAITNNHSSSTETSSEIIPLASLALNSKEQKSIELCESANVLTITPTIAAETDVSKPSGSKTTGCSNCFSTGKGKKSKRWTQRKQAETPEMSEVYCPSCHEDMSNETPACLNKMPDRSKLRPKHKTILNVESEMIVSKRGSLKLTDSNSKRKGLTRSASMGATDRRIKTPSATTMQTKSLTKSQVNGGSNSKKDLRQDKEKQRDKSHSANDKDSVKAMEHNSGNKVTKASTLLSKVSPKRIRANRNAKNQDKQIKKEHEHNVNMNNNTATTGTATVKIKPIPKDTNATTTTTTTTTSTASAPLATAEEIDNDLKIYQQQEEQQQEYEIADDATSLNEFDAVNGGTQAKIAILSVSDSRCLISVDGHEELPVVETKPSLTPHSVSSISTDGIETSKSNTPEINHYRDKFVFVPVNSKCHPLNELTTVNADLCSEIDVSTLENNASQNEIIDNNTNLASLRNINDCNGNEVSTLKATTTNPNTTESIDNDETSTKTKLELNTDTKIKQQSSLPRCSYKRNFSAATQKEFYNRILHLVPKRRTPDGTNIYYWCDLNKKELDDGAYNPLWASRGFTQTFHFWKENRRQQSVPLNAFLTYVTLPWWSIAKDLLDHRETPILTF